MSTPCFSDRLLDWHASEGRHDLPWQHPRTPYRVWLSEIMLQQTQVTTVIPYFERFIARFANLHALAQAPIDEVLSLWSGLGYYARARNLHRCAQQLVQDFNGEFPDQVESLESLPGIGRSTAGAIVSQAFGKRAVILDGNVRRVLARHQGIEGWYGRATVNLELWHAADQFTPNQRNADYTQAIMDLGAQCCTSRSPSCDSCPVRADCVARIEARVSSLPTPKPRKPRRQKLQYLQLSRQQDRWLLLRRPPSGIWGGLWCPPLIDEDQADESVIGAPALAVVNHKFTHFDLELRPRLLPPPQTSIADADDQGWFRIQDIEALGLPAPIRRLFEQLGSMTWDEPSTASS